MSLAEEYGFNFAEESCESLPFSRFPCRKCLPCLLARQKAWVFRLTEELKNHDENYFVTFTYNDDNVPVDDYGQMCFDKKHLVKLNADIRKRYQQGRFRNPVPLFGSPDFFELPKDVKYKYYITSEYGPSESGTHRPHYHSVFYGMQVPLYTFELLLKSLWPYGFVSVFPAEDGAAGYISKYLVTDGVGKQSYTDDSTMSPFALMSKGLGLSYVDRMADWHRQDPQKRMFTQVHGSKGRMDRYLKHKIYDKDTLDEYAEKVLRQKGEIVSRYLKLKAEHPLIYERVLQERRKYFSDMEDSVRWKTIQKHKL